MNIDKKLDTLPLTKSNPATLESIFGDKGVTPMWVADMEFEIAKKIQNALIERIKDSGFGYEYKPLHFFEAQKEWYERRYQVDLRKEHILYSPSITTTLSIAIENFTSAGDGIIIQPPVFMEFKSSIKMTKRNVVKNPLKLADDYYEIDFEDLKEKARIKSNKILILCNPHNPVGRAWNRETLEKVAEICNENDLLLISDEIHKDIILFGNQFCSMLRLADSVKRLIVLTSEAKTFNLCGISDSMAIIQDTDLRASIQQTLKKYNLGRTNALTTVALETAYQNGESWLDKLIPIIEANVGIVQTELKNSNSKIRLIKPEATYQLWLDFRKVFTDTKEMFKTVVSQSNVGLNAGHWFGREGALFMRMNIATSQEKVRDSIRKINI